MPYYDVSRIESYLIFVGLNLIEFIYMVSLNVNFQSDKAEQLLKSPELYNQTFDLLPCCHVVC